MKYLFVTLFCFCLVLGATSSVYATHTDNPNDHRTGLDGEGRRTDLDGEGGKGVAIKNPIEADNIQQLFQAIIDIVLVFAIPIIVLFIIYAGFLYVTARGNTATIEKAHIALLYALIGGLLILGARVLIEVVQGTVDCVQGSPECNK